MHLIAGDSSHCEKQCSPSLCCAVITLAALILSPSLFLQFSTSLLYISLFLPLSICLPLSLLASRSVCCDLVLTVFTLQCSTRNQGNYNSNPGWVSLQIMTIDLCLYYVFSGTLFTSITTSRRSVQLNTAIQWWLNPLMLNKESGCWFVLCVCVGARYICVAYIDWVAWLSLCMSFYRRLKIYSIYEVWEQFAC